MNGLMAAIQNLNIVTLLYSSNHFHLNTLLYSSSAISELYSTLRPTRPAPEWTQRDTGASFWQNLSQISTESYKV